MGRAKGDVLMSTWAEMYDRFPEMTQEPWVTHHTCGSTYVREMHIVKRGHIAVSHKHAYSHLSILGAGEVMVDCGGQLTKYRAPAIITIKADIAHSIEALSDNVVWYCVHEIPDRLKDSEDIGAAMDVVMIKE